MRTCIALRAWRNNVPLEFEIARYPTSRIFTRGGGKKAMEFREIGGRETLLWIDTYRWETGRGGFSTRGDATGIDT